MATFCHVMTCRFININDWQIIVCQEIKLNWKKEKQIACWTRIHVGTNFNVNSIMFIPKEKWKDKVYNISIKTWLIGRWWKENQKLSLCIYIYKKKNNKFIAVSWSVPNITNIPVAQTHVSNFHPVKLFNYYQSVPSGEPWIRVNSHSVHVSLTNFTILDIYPVETTR